LKGSSDGGKRRARQTAGSGLIDKMCRAPQKISNF
jgi:hypothetical protein